MLAPASPRPLAAGAPREAPLGLIFISPWIIGFLAFTLLPMIATLIFTFTNINLTQEAPLRFVGLENYQAVARDHEHVGLPRGHAEVRPALACRSRSSCRSRSRSS